MQACREELQGAIRRATRAEETSARRETLLGDLRERLGRAEEVGGRRFIKFQKLITHPVMDMTFLYIVFFLNVSRTFQPILH